jgi:hypothetical protein
MLPHFYLFPSKASQLRRLPLHLPHDFEEDEGMNLKSGKAMCITICISSKDF